LPFGFGSVDPGSQNIADTMDLNPDLWHIIFPKILIINSNNLIASHFDTIMVYSGTECCYQV